MYTSGLNAYVGGKWFQCSAFLEKAIQERKSYKTVIVDCRLHCRSDSVLSDFFIPADLNTSVDALRLNFFENLVKESHCLKACKTEKLGYQMSENRVLLEIEEDFDNLKPYSYLQFCYYKLERYTDAACAAYTYFLRNPNDQDTVTNIQSYRHDYRVKDEDFKDLEKKPYQDYRIKGENAYDQDDWTYAIELIELAITEYYKEEERCRVECEGHFDHQSFPDFIQAIADHYISVLQCQFKCERKLSILFKDYLPDFVGQHYNFLQYAYHKNGNNDKAVECAATYLLFNPNDEEMLRNKAFYMQKLGYHQAHFVPRQDAKEYENRRDKMLELLYFIRDEYNVMEESEEDTMKGDNLREIELELEKIHMNNTKSKPEKLTKEHYMGIYEKIGIKVKEHKNDRFVADDFYRDDQCRELANFANILEPNSNGVRYLNVAEGLQRIKENTELEISLRLFLRASELARHFSAHFYNKTSFFIKNAAIVCVDPGSEDQHPENCIPQEDGSCLTEDETDDNELLNDQFVLISFLTEDEEPGHFSFLNRRHKKEMPVVSKCGRVVGFRLSDRQRSERSESQRCSMVLIFTSNRKEDSPAHREASLYLLDLEKSRLEVKEVNNTEDMKKFYDNGVRIVMGEKELNSNQRFAADGLITEEQCQALINMNQEGAIGGDGYDRRRSPHTKSETFDGLTISRATELVHVGVISKQAAQLFLDASDYGRLLVEKYFNLTQPLHFDYTHLVCRTAVEGSQEDRQDLSHPVHGDNCELQADGSCIRRFPSYVQRDYSSIMYLNGDFEGGEFFFAHGNKSAQMYIKPKCGRIVGFNSAELHGVKAVKKGKRCALAMWYTMDLNFKELARIEAKKMIDKVPDDVHRNLKSKSEESTKEKKRNADEENNIKNEQNSHMDGLDITKTTEESLIKHEQKNEEKGVNGVKQKEGDALTEKGQNLTEDDYSLKKVTDIHQKGQNLNEEQKLHEEL
ncbi:prolyl 3-hydroxylase 1-like isoform X2 [Mytilus californianus]|uniref:prolyl 3-hydroxylase 1-like isoform X2 n=1 Tax=Mytilus californianus TaxID=6549 RepID=UPI002245239F|nr:prolyl 3-hydroxylase 1-like isoform X2 [Mytilus californianus]